MIFCTLFDSNYLDKGIVMYQSLESVISDFKLYILTMDDNSHKILSALNYQNIVLISMESFLNDELRNAKNHRSKAEFCWTCTAYLIDYVITKYNESICTYIDADLYFYSDPSCLIEEMGEKTVQIVEHRFSKSLKDRANKKKSGNYCVEFNTFKNTEESLWLLRWWERRCIESCSAITGKKSFGDQKYLDGWEKYNYVSVLKNLGGGVAPWNVCQYKLVSTKDAGEVILKDRKTEQKFRLVFYHYHLIEYLDSRKVNIHVYERSKYIDDRIIRKLYLPYLKELDEAKGMLKERFGFYPIILKHPAYENIKKRNVKQIIKTFVKSMPILFRLENFYMRKRVRQKKDIITFE